MNCYYHENKPAVASCVKCGVGLCKSCREEAAYEMDGKPICLNCSRPIAEAELNDAQNTRVWSLVKCIFSGFFLGIALIALLDGAELMDIWIIAGMAGLPTAFKSFRRTAEQRAMDEIEDRYTKDITDLLFGWMIRLLVKLAFIIGLAPFCAVYTFIKNLVKFLKSKKQIMNAQNALDYLDQQLRGEQVQKELSAEVN